MFSKGLFLFAAIIFSFTPADLHAGTLVFGGGAGSGGSSCVAGVNDSAIYDKTGSTGYSSASIMPQNGWEAALQVDVSVASKITQYKFNVYGVAVGGNATASLWTDNAGNLGTQVSSSEAYLNVSSAGINAFVLATPLNINAGTYWVRIKGNAQPTEFTVWVGSASGERYWERLGYFDNYALAAGVWGCPQ